VNEDNRSVSPALGQGALGVLAGLHLYGFEDTLPLALRSFVNDVDTELDRAEGGFGVPPDGDVRRQILARGHGQIVLARGLFTSQRPQAFRDSAKAIAMDRNGKVFVTVHSTCTGEYPHYATIKNSSSVPPRRLDFQLLNTQLLLSWTNVGVYLQSAPAIPGSFTNLPGATSPCTKPSAGPQRYFLLISN